MPESFKCSSRILIVLSKSKDIRLILSYPDDYDGETLKLLVLYFSFPERSISLLIIPIELL